MSWSTCFTPGSIREFASHRRNGRVFLEDIDVCGAQCGDVGAAIVDAVSRVCAARPAAPPVPNALRRYRTDHPGRDLVFGDFCSLVRLQRAHGAWFGIAAAAV